MRMVTKAQNEARALLGLPVQQCPNCGETEPHWIPDSLRGGLVDSRALRSSSRRTTRLLSSILRTSDG